MCILAKIESKSAQSSARAKTFKASSLPRIRDHMQAPPTPNSQRGYVPYGDVPFSPAPYSDFAPQTGASERYIADDEEGVFVSADEVLQLREWANERNQLQESLAAAEQEAEQLRQRLAEVEGTKKAAEQPAAKPRLPLNTIPQYNSRHTAKEVEAIATQRQVEQLTKKSIENAKLREEWRAARETMGRGTGPSFAAGR